MVSLAPPGRDVLAATHEPLAAAVQQNFMSRLNEKQRVALRAIRAALNLTWAFEPD
jgi:hypothetical protein